MLYKKGIYPYEYRNLWERFSEIKLPDKEIFYSKLNNKHIRDEEYRMCMRRVSGRRLYANHWASTTICM